MINTILNGIFNIIIGLVNTILSPIDNLIIDKIPVLDTAFSAIGSFLDLCTSSIGWVISCFGLSSTCLSLIVVYFTFKLSVPILFSTIKLAIKWYNAMKL